MRKAMAAPEGRMETKGHTGLVTGVIFILPLMLIPFLLSCGPADEPPTRPTAQGKVQLPEPRYHSDVSVEEGLQDRRSVREYSDEPLTMGEISQLLWSAQGITDPRDFRTAPSAGALYPLEVYLVAGNVKTLAPGIYKYSPQGHEMVKMVSEDRRQELATAALDQERVEEAAVDIVFTAVYERTTKKYGERGRRYVHMEAGHAAQNLYLQTEALGLGMVVVGAFDDNQVREVVAAPAEEKPLYVIPVGKKR